MENRNDLVVVGNGNVCRRPFIAFVRGRMDKLLPDGQFPGQQCLEGQTASWGIKKCCQILRHQEDTRTSDQSVNKHFSILSTDQYDNAKKMFHDYGKQKLKYICIFNIAFLKVFSNVFYEIQTFAYHLLPNLFSRNSFSNQRTMSSSSFAGNT